MPRIEPLTFYVQCNASALPLNEQCSPSKTAGSKEPVVANLIVIIRLLSAEFTSLKVLPRNGHRWNIPIFLLAVSSALSPVQYIISQGSFSPFPILTGSSDPPVLLSDLMVHLGWYYILTPSGTWRK